MEDIKYLEKNSSQYMNSETLNPIYIQCVCVYAYIYINNLTKNIFFLLPTIHIRLISLLCLTHYFTVIDDTLNFNINRVPS